jgi:hypothetical protein
MATINHKKYDEATETFKDFNVYDGKETLIFKVDGEAGNVGIGVTSTAAALDIRKDSGVYELVKIQNNLAGALYRAVGAGGGSADFGADDSLASTAIFRTAGSERMRITSVGTVGINSTPPSSVTLDIKEADAGADLILGLSAGTGARSQIRSGADLATASNLQFHTVSASNTFERMRITSDGNVTIKADSAAGGGVLNLENTTTTVNGQDWGSVNFISNDVSTSASGIRASIVGTSTSFNGDGNIVFSTAPSNGVNTERMRVLSSGGLTFNGDTAAANALDDYEEGTWTPSFIFQSGSATYTTQSGTYTKVGRVVTVQMYILINTVSSVSGTLEVQGMPFTAGSGTIGSVSIFAQGLDASAKQWVGVVTGSSTTMRIYNYDAGTLTNPAATLLNSSTMNLTATYFV